MEKYLFIFPVFPEKKNKTNKRKATKQNKIQRVLISFRRNKIDDLSPKKIYTYIRINF